MLDLKRLFWVYEIELFSTFVEVPLQRRRSTTRAPQTKHGVVHRNHRKSTPQTRRRRRARVRRETGRDLGLNTNPKSPV